jgi:hypothetical protein
VKKTFQWKVFSRKRRSSYAASREDAQAALSVHQLQLIKNENILFSFLYIVSECFAWQQ